MLTDVEIGTGDGVATEDRRTLGYELVGRTDDTPRGDRGHSFRKRLDPSA